MTKPIVAMKNLPETHTAMRLAKRLNDAGLNEMAEKAKSAYYHDYLSPLAAPSIQLLNDLKRQTQTDKVRSLITGHLNGEFDASTEESDNWAKSEEGKVIANEIGPELSKILGMG